jgi:hypothetical protein
MWIFRTVVGLLRTPWRETMNANLTKADALAAFRLRLPQSGMQIVLILGAQSDVTDSCAIGLHLYLSPSVQANEFDECVVPGKFSAAKHQLFKLTFRGST